MYMGSRDNGDDPDEILKQNHHMLASIHQGRSVFYYLFMGFTILFFRLESISVF